MIGNTIAGGLSVFTPLATNSYFSIATQTVGAGGASSITFSSIPNTYKHLQIRLFALNSTWCTVRFNSDTGSNYAGHELRGDGSTVYAGGGNNTQIYAGLGSGNVSDPSVFVMDILDYANTNKYKTMRTLTGGDANGSGYIQLTSGLWMNTTAISTISLQMFNGSNFNQYTHAALYGVN